MKQFEYLKGLEGLLSEIDPKGNGTSFRKTFHHLYQMKYGTDAKYARVFSGFVWSEYNDEWAGCIGHETKREAYTLLSVFNGKPLVVAGYPIPKNINNINFSSGVKYHIVPKYDGVLVTTFTMPNGIYWGKTQEIEYLDRNGGMNVNFQKILKDLGVWDKLHSASEEYNIAIHGMIVGRELTASKNIPEYDYVAVDICDRQSYAMYTKEISEQIFKEFDIPYEKTIQEDEVNSAIADYNGVMIKIYMDGELNLFQKELDVPKDVRYKKVVRNMFGNNCDFCWTNPAMDNKIESQIWKYSLDASINDIRASTLRVQKTPELVEKIKGWLDCNYKIAGYMTAETVYDKYKWKWQWSGTDDKEMIIEIIREWQKELRYKSADEIFRLENSVSHSDNINF